MISIIVIHCIVHYRNINLLNSINVFLILPLQENMTLFGLMSMWTIFSWCMKLRASRICPEIILHLFSFSWNVLCAMVLKRSLPPRYSVMMQLSLIPLKYSTTLTMNWHWDSFLSNATSEAAAYFWSFSRVSWNWGRPSIWGKKYKVQSTKYEQCILYRASLPARRECFQCIYFNMVLREFYHGLIRSKLLFFFSFIY